MGITRVPPVYSSTRRAVSTTTGRHGGQCWKLSVAGRPGDVHEDLADLLGVEHLRSGHELLHERGGCRLTDTAGPVHPDDHETGR